MKRLLKTMYQLEPSLFDEVLALSDVAPLFQVDTVTTKFVNDPSRLEWVFNTRGNPDPKYEISSLWNIPTVMPEFASHIVWHMRDKTGIEFAVTDFYMVRTKGTVPPHRDLGTALCKFNFGVRNTRLAFTVMYDDQQEMSSVTNMRDGQGYLLDPFTTHSVESMVDPRTPLRLIPYRYIATFKVSQPFESVARTSCHALHWDTYRTADGS